MAQRGQIFNEPFRSYPGKARIRVAALAAPVGGLVVLVTSDEFLAVAGDLVGHFGEGHCGLFSAGIVLGHS